MLNSHRLHAEFEEFEACKRSVFSVHTIGTEKLNGYSLRQIYDYKVISAFN